MDMVLEIKACKTLEELKELADEAVKFFTDEGRKYNPDFDYIGTKLDINPINYHLDDINFEIEADYEARPFWMGYVPNGTKIVYGRFANDKYRTSVHGGYYYYNDDDSYIYEFFKYIKDKEVESDYDIIVEVNSFLRKKLGKYFNPVDKEQLNKLLYKTDDLFFRPVKEHSIKDYYNNGSALCSEYALMAQNILSALGLEVMMFADYGHTYNIYVEHEGEYSGIYVLDFSNWVEVVDINFNLIGVLPYYEKIEGADSDLIDKVVNEGKRIILPDYYFYFINGNMYKMVKNKNRDYGTDFGVSEDKKLILSSKKKQS